jgi:pimeloyl-ACP methyl ester carboxylesterase
MRTFARLLAVSGMCGLAAVGVVSGLSAVSAQAPSPGQDGVAIRTISLAFKSYDLYDMRGKLTLPQVGTPAMIVIYVQTAEAMTVDMRRPLGGNRTFNYFDLYREKLPQMRVGFFSYEGRGVSMGDAPPRYETIDRAMYDTSTLENKVRDVLAAIETVRGQPDLAGTPIWLIGASEGTLIAAQAAAAKPEAVAGLILYGVLSDNMRVTFRYIMSDGAFLVYRLNFDADGDGRISTAEFEADPQRYRARVLRGAPFDTFDKNNDGWFTVDEMSLLNKRYLDAVAADDYAVLQAWAATNAGATIPRDWFKDHFAQSSIWESLKGVDIPVGLFHGDRDTNTPIDGLRKLELAARAAGKRKMEFHYFEGLDHSLNVGQYFTRGELPAGHRAIFEFISRQVSN